MIRDLIAFLYWLLSRFWAEHTFRPDSRKCISSRAPLDILHGAIGYLNIRQMMIVRFRFRRPSEANDIGMSREYTDCALATVTLLDCVATILWNNVGLF